MTVIKRLTPSPAYTVRRQSTASELYASLVVSILTKSCDSPTEVTLHGLYLVGYLFPFSSCCFSQFALSQKEVALWHFIDKTVNQRILLIYCSEKVPIVQSKYLFATTCVLWCSTWWPVYLLPWGTSVVLCVSVLNSPKQIPCIYQALGETKVNFNSCLQCSN